MFSKKASNGFTLIEVVISMVVVSLALVTFIMSMITFARDLRFDEKSLEAINLIEFYQSQAQAFSLTHCHDDKTKFGQFLCGTDTSFDLKLDKHPMHPWSEGTLSIKKSKHQALTQLDYEVKQQAVLLRSQQWVDI